VPRRPAQTTWLPKQPLLPPLQPQTAGQLAVKTLGAPAAAHPAQLWIMCGACLKRLLLLLILLPRMQSAGDLTLANVRQ
jgi:hypothetical protein